MKINKKLCVDCGVALTGHAKTTTRCRGCAGILRRGRIGERTPLVFGDRFGKLTVIKLTDKTKNYNKSIVNYYLCKCDCGKIKVINKVSLLSGGTQSCGCLILESNRSRHKEITPINKLFKNYQNSAKIRKHVFNLTFEEFKKLTSSDCYYCNRKPAQIKKSDYFNYTYNGLDRIDNAKGYVLDNVVPCCKHCNYAKKGMSTEKFYNLIKLIYENIKNRF